MARSARRRSARADWVYRDNRWLQQDPTQPEPTSSGTYGPSIALPVSTLTGQVLYDSTMVTERKYGSVDPATGTYLDIEAASRPESNMRGALIHGVEVNLCWRPSTWALGSLVWLGCRIVVADQDAYTGQAQLDVNYSLWTGGGDAQTTIARFANGRQNCHERRVFEQFNENSTRMDVRYYARFKRRLQPQEGLFLLLETHPLSVNLTSLNMYCRTLVTD